MQPRSWLGQEADFRAVLLVAATTTTGSRGPSEFTNNSGGGRGPCTEMPGFLSIQRAESTKPPFQYEKSHELICFQAGKVGHPIPPGLPTPGVSSSHLGQK